MFASLDSWAKLSKWGPAARLKWSLIIKIQLGFLYEILNINLNFIEFLWYWSLKPKTTKVVLTYLTDPLIALNLILPPQFYSVGYGLDLLFHFFFYKSEWKCDGKLSEGQLENYYFNTSYPKNYARAALLYRVSKKSTWPVPDLGE